MLKKKKAELERKKGMTLGTKDTENSKLSGGREQTQWGLQTWRFESLGSDIRSDKRPIKVWEQDMTLSTFQGL